MSKVYLQIHTRYLIKTWRFYSCLGMAWDELDEEEPVSEEPAPHPYGWMAKKYKVPEYSGTLGDIAIDFFYSETPQYISPNSQRFLFVHCESQDEVKAIAERLKKAGFSVCSGIKKGWDGDQKDPDGRLVYITMPSIGEVFKSYFDERDKRKK